MKRGIEIEPGKMFASCIQPPSTIPTMLRCGPCEGQRAGTYIIIKCYSQTNELFLLILHSSCDWPCMLPTAPNKQNRACTHAKPTWQNCLFRRAIAGLGVKPKLCANHAMCHKDAAGKKHCTPGSTTYRCSRLLHTIRSIAGCTRHVKQRKTMPRQTWNAKCF